MCEELRGCGVQSCEVVRDVVFSLQAYLQRAGVKLMCDVHYSLQQIGGNSAEEVPPRVPNLVFWVMFLSRPIKKPWCFWCFGVFVPKNGLRKPVTIL